MGIFKGCIKVICCAAVGAAAVVAAPVVLSAAAVAGTAALGAAASAGAAAAGAATAVGTAAAGVASTAAAGAAGAAVTTVSTVAAGALEVGAVAGVITEVAVGTVATAGTAAAAGEAVALGTTVALTGGTIRAGTRAVTNFGESFIDNVIKDRAFPLDGCIVKCDLALGQAEHSGVYSGGKIIELDGSGKIREIAPDTFIDSSTVRTAISIYIACDNEGNVLHDSATGVRAREMLGKKRNYNVILDNCHQFTSGCIQGSFENADNFFWMLEERIKNDMNQGEGIQWLVWDRNYGD